MGAAQQVVDSIAEIAAVSPFRAEFRKKQKEDIQKARNSSAADGDYYAVIDFGSEETKTAWLQANKFDVGTKHLNFEQIKHLVRRPTLAVQTKKKPASKRG